MSGQVADRLALDDVGLGNADALVGGRWEKSASGRVLYLEVKLLGGIGG